MLCCSGVRGGPHLDAVPGVAPDHGVVEGLAGSLAPYYSGLPLVGDAQATDPGELCTPSKQARMLIFCRVQ